MIICRYACKSKALLLIGAFCSVKVKARGSKIIVSFLRRLFALEDYLFAQKTYLKNTPF